MEAEARNRRRSSFASGGATYTLKVLMLLGDEGDGEAARGPGKPSLVFDEIERLPCGMGSEGTLASSVRSEPRTTGSTEVVYALIHVIFSDTNIPVYLHKKYY